MGSSVKASHLLTPIYLLALAGLLLNDHVLKAAMPGLITGKLSDFCGLFALAVFLSVMCPRWTLAWHVGLAAAFIAWKSPAADGLIRAWNATMPFRIARVVDYWDLTAVSVLPLSIAYLRRDWRVLSSGVTLRVVVASASLFAFAATSRPPWEGEIIAAKDYVRAGEHERAVKVLDQVVRYAPYLPEAWHLRGMARLNLGDVAGGEADILAAAALDPKYRPHPHEPCSGEC